VGGRLGQVAPAGAGRTRWRRWLLGYLGVQLVLVLVTVVQAIDHRGWIGLLVVGLSATTLTVAMAIRRPARSPGWWWVVAAGLAELVLLVVVWAVDGVGQPVEDARVLPIGLALVIIPLLAIGLTRLGQPSPHGAAADALDSLMVATAAFLLIWSLLIDPFLDAGPDLAGDAPGLARVIGLPFGALVLLALATRLVLGGGLRNGSYRILLLSVLAMVAGATGVLLPAFQLQALVATVAAALFLAVHSVLLGAAALHPALDHPPPVPSTVHTADISTRRVLSYMGLGLIAPLAWALELADANDTLADDLVGFTVPVVFSAVFLILLTGRLGLLARLAQRRAAELARRTAALAEAAVEQDELRKQLIHRALHDPLTGLPNRVVLAERLEWSLTRRAGSGQLALLLLDLDRFKDVNDTLGHPAGDELLRTVAHRLVDLAPPGSTLARLGGDEFAVLLEDTTVDAAVSWAESVLEMLSRPYLMLGRDLALTTSIGVWIATPTEQQASTPSDALRDADLALYAAKEAGKNRAVVFAPDLRTSRLEHIQVAAGLRRALANDEFLLHYQPVVDPSTGRTSAVEALVRWQPPNGPAIPPDDFIPIAEEAGLIGEIGTWVLRHALRDSRPWWEAYGVAVSVNVSGRQITDPDFADLVMAALAEAELPGAALILEITENHLVATARADVVHTQLRRLREHDVRIAIDDFGTGYSSLSYVAQLPIDIVKIDRALTQFRRDAQSTAQDLAFIRAILQLIGSLRVVAIAEGVETSDQAEALRDLHCPLVQGFHFARPQPARDIEQALAIERRWTTTGASR
jgi:diguanylate cyclase (GGDEF)-like protein